MLGDISGVENIYIVCGYTDMRKAIDGLCAVVEEVVKRDPRENSLFLFCGKRCDRIKALMYDGSGFVLIYKRLDNVRGRYRWPRDNSEARNLTWQEFDWLMSGLDIEQPKAIRANFG
jgi:transposase